MTNTIGQYLNGLAAPEDRAAILPIVNAIGDRLSSCSLSSAGLTIKSGSSPTVKTGASAWYGAAQGKLQTKAAATDMPALSGTVTNATFNVYVFVIDASGTVTAAMGTAGSTLARAVFPSIPEGKAVIGCVLIHPTGTGNFVGGTTNLDDATVVPNAAYVNVTGPFDPSVLL